MASSSSGSSKRARVTTNNAIQAATCLVDGCTADLTNCRKYHQRHKVCEAHSKAPQVSINGQKLRFCQQCSRFHSLEEFDDAKRSCRKRLDGHNLRRRKPQPNLLSVHHGPGTTMLHFSGPHVHPAMALAKPPWAGIAKTSSGIDKPFSDEYLAPAQLDYLDCAPSLLSSSPSQTSCTTLSHVVHPSASSISTTENSSDVGPHHHAFCDREDPHTLPFYWQ